MRAAKCSGWSLASSPKPSSPELGGGSRPPLCASLLSALVAVTLLGGCETLPSADLGQGGVDAPVAQAAKAPGKNDRPAGDRPEADRPEANRPEAEQATFDPPGFDRQAKRLAGDSGAESSTASGGFFAGLFGGSCRAGENKNCAEDQAKKADDCLRQAIELPHSTSYRDQRMRQLLGCAERSYRKALELSASDQGSIRRVAYHGGLLLALSERRNRLDDNTREPRIGRENGKLLEAADATREEAPESALGFLYGASARLFRATLSDDPASVCTDLREAAAMLDASPPPPDALAGEQERLTELALSELKRCNTLAGMTTRGDG